MPVPHPDRAIVDIRKLRDYCLNPAYDEGQHKARVFAAALGLTVTDAEALRAILLEVVQTHEAHFGYREPMDNDIPWTSGSTGRGNEPRCVAAGFSNMAR
jgi:hypothetical protein